MKENSRCANLREASDGLGFALQLPGLEGSENISISGQCKMVHNRLHEKDPVLPFIHCSGRLRRNANRKSGGKAGHTG